MVKTEELADAHDLAALLRLSHPNSVSTYQRRYPDMPRPVLDLGRGRPKLWLRRMWSRGYRASGSSTQIQRSLLVWEWSQVQALPQVEGRFGVTVFHLAVHHYHALRPAPHPEARLRRDRPAGEDE